jgi:RHS repeat-associated protein
MPTKPIAMKKISSFRIIALLVILQLAGLYSYAQSTTQNYVMTRVPGTPIKTAGRLDTLTGNKDSVQTTIQYVDGLGRPIQTVQVYGSPTGKDVVQPQAYDQFGREPLKYQPYSISPGVPGMYQSAALSGTGGYTGSQQYSFYQQSSPGYATTTAPYAATGFELSPLQRVLEQGSPGTAWQPYSSGISGSGHTVKMAYLNNNTVALTDTANTRRVALYTAGISSNGARTLARTGSNTAVYAANQLSVSVVKDENWTSGRAGTSEEYKDKSGHVVLKRTFNYKSGVLEILSTYYVYDDMGQLAFVLPPGASPDAAAAISSATLNSFCYQYRYDERGRLVEKKLPGKGWDFLVYNQLDQVVATQDSNQRVQNRWLFTKYDAMGRVALTGIWDYSNTAISRAGLQSVLNTQSVFWETAVSSGNGYTDNVWPTGWTTTLGISYYDNYSFPGYTYGPWTGGTMTQPKGMITGSLTTVLNPDGSFGDALWTVQHYDDKGRLAQTSKQHYLGGHAGYSTGNYDVSIPEYNFNDQPVVSFRYHVVNYSVPFYVADIYKFDHMGRRTAVYAQITPLGTVSPAPTLLSRAGYNELGQLLTKGLHSADWGATFLQSISYAYNERGWLRTANSSGNLFNMELKYNTGSNPQYNGNIGQMLYTGLNSGSKAFTYGYDKLNRLTRAVSTGGTLDESLVYDVMGNITGLTRGGQAYGALSYSYSGNQLGGVSGSGFTSRAYAYDGNGNATSDGGSKTISYNLFNLPRKVRNGSTELANYTYDAGGAKLSNVSTSAGANDGTWEYIGGIVYHNGAVAFISTEEGRAVPNGSGGYTYQYNLKDHLGNDRLNFYSNSGVATVLQEDEYYSFGLRHGLYDASNNNRYLYNGKELQTDLANQYDYGARFYDPVIGRWTAVDPLAEESRRWSVYNYTDNDPINNIDPDGMQTSPVGPKSMGDPNAFIAESFRQYFQGAGALVDRFFASFSTSTDTKTSDAKVGTGGGSLKVTTSINVTNTTTVGTGFGDFFKMNSQNTPRGPIMKVTNTTEVSKQTKTEASTTVRGVDVKLTNTTNVGTKKTTTNTEVSAGKTITSTSGKTSVGASAYVAVKATSSNGQNTSQTSVGIKASVSYSPSTSVTVTNTIKAGVVTSQ